MDKDSFKGLAVFAANQSKLHLEKQYDRFGQTEVIESIKALPYSTRYGIATGLNALAAVFERNFGEETAFRTFIKKIAEDAGPELGKRIVNGGPEEKMVFATFLAMGKEDLIGLLEWLSKTPDAERQRIIRRMSKLSSEEINLIVSLPPEQFARFRDYFWKEKDQANEKSRLPEDPIGLVRDGFLRLFIKKKKD